MPGRDGVEVLEDGPLDLHPLGDGLDDEVDVAEALVLGRPVDAVDDARDLGVGRLLVELAALDELLDLPGRDLARLGEPGLDELVAGRP